MNYPPTLFRREEFDTRVWSLVQEIPTGKVLTYGDIANRLEPPLGVPAEVYRVHGPRWVGQAMANSPAHIPWQRVVNGQGRISDRRSGGAILQRKILEEEGVAFDDQDRIDLNRYRWNHEPTWVQRTLW